MLADLDPNLGQIVHLVGARDAHIVRLSQIHPASAPALRAVRHPLIRDAHPRHRVALGACCFPRWRPEFFARFGVGFALPRRSSLEGGIEELPLFREACRSSRRTRSSSATLDSRNFSTRAISSSRDSSSNPDTAQDHHITQPTHHARHAEDQTTDLNAYLRAYPIRGCAVGTQHLNDLNDSVLLGTASTDHKPVTFASVHDTCSLRL
jgi:hypothetical protein